MAIIFVHNLIISGTHGAHLPTAKPKDFKIDMEIEVASIEEAVATDDIHHVYDYRRAVHIAKSIIEGPSVHLIETLAHQITKKVLEDSKVTKIKLTLAKREFHDSFDSGIVIERKSHLSSLDSTAQ